MLIKHPISLGTTMHNEDMLNMLATVAIRTINKLTNDNQEILANPTNNVQLDEQVSMVKSIVVSKLRNKLLKK